MSSIRRKARKAAKKSARRTAPRRLLLRLAFRVARPLAPGMIAGYFLDKAAGAERRRKAIAAAGTVAGKVRGSKGP
jgi:hypothetical protein